MFLFVSLLVAATPAMANISYRNVPVFNYLEFQLSKLVQERKMRLCNEQLMEFAASIADRYAETNEFDNAVVDGVADDLRAEMGDADYEPVKLSMLYGRGFDTPKAFFDSIVASATHAAVIDDASLTEFGVGYSPNRFYWVALFASPSANATRPMRLQCPAFETSSFWLPVSSDTHKFSRVSLGAPNDILAIDASGAYVRNYKPCFAVPVGGDAVCSSVTCCPNWSLGMAPSAGAQSVSVSYDGTCFASTPSTVGAPLLFVRDPLVNDNHSSMKWTLFPGSLTRVAVGRKENVWGITAQHKLFRLNVAAKKWIPLSGQWSRVAVGFDNTVYAIEFMTQKIYRRSGGKWQRVKGRLIDVAVGDRNSVFGIGTDNQVYVYANDTLGWRRADDADVVIDKTPALYAASIAVGATAYEIWILDNMGEAHRAARPDTLYGIVQGRLGKPMAPFDDDNLHLTMPTINDTTIVTDSDMKAEHIDANPQTVAEEQPIVVGPAMLGRVIAYNANASPSPTSNSSSLVTTPLATSSAARALNSSLSSSLLMLLLLPIAFF